MLSGWISSMYINDKLRIEHVFRCDIIRHTGGHVTFKVVLLSV